MSIQDQITQEIEDRHKQKCNDLKLDILNIKTHIQIHDYKYPQFNLINEVKL